MATTTKSKTGSQKLKREGRGFSAASVRAFVTVLKKYKFDRGVFIHGKPNPDFVKGRFTTKDSAAVLAVLRSVMKLEGIHKGIKILPNGQPPMIDRFDVEIPGIKA